MDIQLNLTPSEPVKPKWTPSASQKKIALFGGIIILILLAGYGYASYLARNNYNEVVRQSEEAQKAAQTLEQQRAQDPTSGWQTYRNEEYGFEFKYPQSMKAFDNADGVASLKLVEPEELSETDFNSGDYFSIQFVFNVGMNPDGLSARDLYESSYKKLYSVDATDRVINGIKVVEFKAAEPLKRIRLLVVHGLDGMLISYTDSPKYINDYNQILSTFKFIDVADTSTWKTYTNTEYGFEVKYPGDWEISTENGGVKQEVKYINFKSPGGPRPDLTITYNTTVFNQAGGLDAYVKSNQDSYTISKNNASKINFLDNQGWEIISQGMVSHYSVLVLHNSHLYEIAFNLRENKQDLTQVEKEIFSTFRFIGGT